MYFKNIFCIETQHLSRQEKINTTTSIGNIDYNYWEVEEIDGGEFLRIKPLFNCDKLESTNYNDMVIEENKVIICKNRMDTIITATSNDGDE